MIRSLVRGNAYLYQHNMKKTRLLRCDPIQSTLDSYRIIVHDILYIVHVGRVLSYMEFPHSPESSAGAGNHQLLL